MDNQIDAATGTVKPKAVFPNKASRLFPISSSTRNLSWTSSTVRSPCRKVLCSVARAGTYVHVVTPEKLPACGKVQLA